MSNDWNTHNEETFEYYYNSYKYGTYAEVKPTEESADTLAGITKKAKPNDPVEKEDLHTTLVFSIGKGNPTMQPSHDVEYVAYLDSFELFGENRDILVISLESEDLEQRHNYLIHNGLLRHSFEKYRPHVTIGYNFSGDLPNKEKLLRDNNGDKIKVIFKGEKFDYINPNYIE
ncbi:hypothetical protein PBI_SCTP2_158 [Salicola phage SCTP-2]|nr:hypothetical protein PBI_SCTP2_158 [Salicola phage SCTP-2]